MVPTEKEQLFLEDRAVLMNHIAPIRLITVSRQFGAGGREVADRLSEVLGWKIWHRELLTEIANDFRSPEAELAQMDEREVDRSLWGRLRSKPAYKAYLAALKEYIEQLGDEGHAIVVGRGASILLRYRAGALHLRLVAPLSVRSQRAQETEPGLDSATAQARCSERDEERSRFVKYFFGEDVGDPLSYHATVNTGALTPTMTAESLVRVVNEQRRSLASVALGSKSTVTHSRIIALSSEVGSRETDLARELARRMKLPCWDRESLAREAGFEEGPNADFGEVGPAAFEAFGKVISRLAAQDDAIIVGGGSSAFLKDHPGAMHVKLIAPRSERIRRVSEYRWIDPASAEAAIVESDKRRGLFYRQFFNIDWDDPLSFDMVLNTAALGPRTVSLIAEAAKLKWNDQLTMGSVPAVTAAAAKNS
jgi:cytidylate kinase